MKKYEGIGIYIFALISTIELCAMNMNTIQDYQQKALQDIQDRQTINFRNVVLPFAKLGGIAGAYTGGILKILNQGYGNNLDLKRFLQMTALVTAVSGAATAAWWGGLGLGLLYWNKVTMPTGWLEQINQLKPEHFTNKTVTIQGQIRPKTISSLGKKYFLAKNFDDIESVGYGFDATGQPLLGDGNHYEIYPGSDPAHRITLFLEISDHFNEEKRLEEHEADVIAFIALRPTPYIKLESGEIVPQIIIGLKDSASKEDALSIINEINDLIRTTPDPSSMKPSAHPWGSQKQNDFISAGFGSLSYKKEHLNEFKTPSPSFTLGLSMIGSPAPTDDAAYPLQKKEELNLKPAEAKIEEPPKKQPRWKRFVDFIKQNQ